MSKEEEIITQQKDGRNTDHWTVDRRIPLALIFAIFMQTIGAVWWAASTSNRVDALEKRMNVAENLTERVVRLEVVLINVEKTLDRLNKTLDRISNRSD